MDQQNTGRSKPAWPADFPSETESQPHDVNMDVPESFLALPSFLGSSTELWATLSDDYYHDPLGIAPGPMFDLEPACETRSPIDIESSQPLSHGIESALPETDASSGGGINLGPNSGHFIDLRESTDSFQLDITRLSQLSTRLTHLLSFSRSFLSENVETLHDPVHNGQALKAQAGVESVFKSINNWLVCETGNAETVPNYALGPTTTFDLLHHAFSASDQLLEILSRLGAGIGMNNLSSVATGLPSPISAVINPSAEAEKMKFQVDPSQSTSLIIYHLVLACITLLLNIYESILMNLQRCADTLQHDSTSPDKPRSEHSDQIDTASRTHLQLVSVVQMCSYFIGRQNQNLDTILFDNDIASSPPRKYTTKQSTPSAHVRHLKNEVERRLKTLKECLQIVG
ncbi:hypothetical protein F4861DRAFT_548934 [Xylaria intraflava]|nr:hypothetical protein F4861DRAFT_548934 [Xylaria intraflava]